MHLRAISPIVITSLITLSPTTHAQQENDWWLTHTKNWYFNLGFSRFNFDPDLPASFENHETHPTDTVRFQGLDAGTTDLSSVDISFLDIAIIYSRPMQSLPIIKHAELVLKIPSNSSGRTVKQNENDTSKPEEAAFLFSEIDDLSPAIEIGAGFTYLPIETQHWSVGLRPQISLGYWNMDFSKGWLRNGNDETALSTAASGFSIAPKISFVIAGRALNKFNLVAHYTNRSINLDFDNNTVSSTTANGWETGITVSYRFCCDLLESPPEP